MIDRVSGAGFLRGDSHFRVYGLAFWQSVVIALTFFSLAFLFSPGLTHILSAWNTEEYSHGYFLPLVTLFLVWQKKSRIAQMPFEQSWFGVIFLLFGLLAYFVGELSTLYIIIQYAFFVAFGGVLLAALGSSIFWLILPAYLLLFFAIPLPSFLYNNLSSQLQLWSSGLGVFVIRLLGISVYLEGNVIDLGNYKLQVVEACSGLRYLFPLSALGFIAAIFFRGAFWKKLFLFLSTAPIAVLMNGLRIAVVGVLVYYAGPEQADGFVHDFEGWVVFLICTALLVLEMWMLARIGAGPMHLTDAFAIEGPSSVPEGAIKVERTLPVTFLISCMLILLALTASLFFTQYREETIPERAEFLFFPDTISTWQGKRDRLEPMYLDALKLDDYLLSEYRQDGEDSINLYIAYYDSQRKGASVHSPKSCLPGGGWRISSLTQRVIPDSLVAGRPVWVNRALIQMGDERMLVYYWFQQRGRIMTNEYLVKWYLFWDALTRHRTDGALVRLTTAVGPVDDLDEKDAMLAEFVQAIDGRLPRFIPD